MKVLSVHVVRFRWAELQMRYLRHNLKCDWTMDVVVDRRTANRIDKSRYISVTLRHRRTHADNLRFLLSTVKNDIESLLVLDSDAWPVSPITDEWVSRMLDQYLLVAAELRGERRPHASFLLSTARRLRALDDPFRMSSYRRVGPDGVSRTFRDVGGHLETLPRKSWLPLRQTARLGSHHELFAVYGDLAYHHGGGSRTRQGTFEETVVAHPGPEGVRERRRVRRRLAAESAAILRRLRVTLPERFWSLARRSP